MNVISLLLEANSPKAAYWLLYKNLKRFVRQTNECKSFIFYIYSSISYGILMIALRDTKKLVELEMLLKRYH